ncbi:MAG: hypothetical protein IT459_23315 [Planctomycetes bacterium]|nr:hypothetical protein [Planctomycetota bacterium]
MSHDLDRTYDESPEGPVGPCAAIRGSGIDARVANRGNAAGVAAARGDDGLRRHRSTIARDLVVDAGGFDV